MVKVICLTKGEKKELPVPKGMYKLSDLRNLAISTFGNGVMHVYNGTREVRKRSGCKKGKYGNEIAYKKVSEPILVAVLGFNRW